MKLAIHHFPGRYSEQWMEYCKANGIEYKLVNCYDTDILQQIADCDGLMWNWDQNNYRSPLMAKQLTSAVQLMGKEIFPDYNTCWHFDDKLGQKYLFESVGAPLIKSYVFYSKEETEKWLDTTTYPKVFKLRSGAGSVNVKLVRTRSAAQSLINQAFGSGFSQNNRWGRLKDKFWVLKRDKNVEALKGIAKGIGRLFIPTELAKFSHHEKGYAYFQEFVPGNDSDIRIFVTGNKCMGLKRFVRENDFRASGSGVRAYEKELIDERCVRISFDVCKKLGLQTAAFDFIFENGEPRIIEVSYSSVPGPFYHNCHGYWDTDIVWHPGKVTPEYYMIESFIERIQNKKGLK